MRVKYLCIAGDSTTQTMPRHKQTNAHKRHYELIIHETAKKKKLLFGPLTIVTINGIKQKATTSKQTRVCITMCF